jgi:hypothetical protein
MEKGKGRGGLLREKKGKGAMGRRGAGYRGIGVPFFSHRLLRSFKDKT